MVKFPAIIEKENEKETATENSIMNPFVQISSHPAPTCPRPFAHIINPYNYNCSILCNHPKGLHFGRLPRRFTLESTSTLFTTLVSHLESKTNDFTNMIPSKSINDRSGKTPMVLSGAANSYNSKSTSKIKTKKLNNKTVKFSNETSRLDQKKASDKCTVKFGLQEKSNEDAKNANDANINKKATKSKKRHRKSDTQPGVFCTLLEDVENPSTLVEAASTGYDESYDKADGQLQLGSRRRRKTIHREDSINSTSVISTSFETQLYWESEDGGEFNPKRLEEMEQTLSQLKQTAKETELGRSTKELQILSEEINKKNLKSDSWMNYPRKLTGCCSRFQLPLDAKLLENMKTADYLSKHCVIPRKRYELFNRVFAKSRGIDGCIIFKNLGKVMNDVFGFPLHDDWLQDILSTHEFNEETSISFEVFVGISALAERWSYSKLISNSGSTYTDGFTDKLEKLDFGLLTEYLKDVNLKEPLCNLLYWIQKN